MNAITSKQSLRINELPELPNNLHAKVTQTDQMLLAWMSILVSSLLIFSAIISFTQGDSFGTVEKTQHIKGVILLMVMYVVVFLFSRYLTKKWKQTHLLTIKSYDGADFSIQFVKTPRYRYLLGRNTSQSRHWTNTVEVVTTNNCDCRSAHLFCNESKTKFWWIFVECKRPGRGGRYVQILPVVSPPEVQDWGFEVYNELNKLQITGLYTTQKANASGQSTLPFNFMLSLPKDGFKLEKLESMLKKVNTKKQQAIPQKIAVEQI